MNPIFQYYPNFVKARSPIGNISISTLLSKIKQPSTSTIDLYNRIVEATDKGDETTRKELKSKLYFFTPAVFVNPSRKYEDIVNWTGLMPLDFDKIHYANEFRDYLIGTYSFIHGAWLSTSKHGVRAIAKIPICNSVDEYKAYFFGIKKVLGRYKGFDSTSQNCVLPLFLSYDPDIKINSEVTTFSDTGINEKAMSFSIPTECKKVETNDIYIKKIEKIITTGIEKIHDNGHPQLRSLAVALGGYVSSGYIDEYLANQIICSMIRSNIYLNQKPEVYERTAKEMIKFGQSKPLYL